MVARSTLLMLLTLSGPFLLPTPLRAETPATVVYVADGAGRLPGPSGNLSRLGEQHAFLVESVSWSHGIGRVLMDMYSQSNHRTRGQELAAKVLAKRKAAPTARIVLVAHSAGAMVVLTAAEHLPSGSVDRIILLAPAVSPSYDLRSALLAAREGIDSFSCHHDYFALGQVLFGSADGYHLELPAGNVGFRTPAANEWPMFGNLRQHTDGYIGHFSCTLSGFLGERVVPLVTRK